MHGHERDDRTGLGAALGEQVGATADEGGGVGRHDQAEHDSRDGVETDDAAKAVSDFAVGASLIPADQIAKTEGHRDP
ncbi:MAG: hypothetical protein U1E73_03055 [Planctomycetota bacterium]